MTLVRFLIAVAVVFRSCHDSCCVLRKGRIDVNIFTCSHDLGMCLSHRLIAVIVLGLREEIRSNVGLVLFILQSKVWCETGGPGGLGGGL